MALSMISPIASKLGNLLVEEVTFLCGIDDKIKNLQKEFTWMQCFLEDIDARQDESKSVHNWVAQIREIAYDVDDVIDIYNINVESQREKGCMSFMGRCTCIFNEACTLHKLGSSIDAITTQITTLTRQLETYGVKHSTKGDDSSSLQRKKEERRSYPHIVERNVVGLENDIKDLVPVLVAEKKEFQTVAIWGMGGIGKTTLAKQIYRDNKVRQHFNCFGWAYVSQQCQLRDVWQELALSLVPEQRSEILMMKDAELPRKLHQILTTKKCLIVVDDVWKIEDWNSLKVAFPYEEMNSIILVTSRNKEIASHPNCFVHEMQPLNEDNGWKLLQKIAIRKTTDIEMDAIKEEFGKKILTHCKGLPLAITVVGGILAMSQSINEWETMSKNIKSVMKKNKSHTQGNFRVYDVLALSFNLLPSHLKPCFLYLGLFPEDHAISVTELVQMWIAEGFITSHQIEDVNETMEDVGEDYIRELVVRCLVLVEENDLSLNRVKTCRLHDLMRDFCLSKSSDESFLYVFDRQHGEVNSCPYGSCSKINNCHRLALHKFVFLDHISGPLLNPRSLLFFNQLPDDELSTISSYCEKLITLCRVLSKVRRSQKILLNKFKRLRVLNYADANPEPCWLLKDIGKLIHLRYLSVRGVGLCKIPSSLGDLKLLQTLDLQAEGFCEGSIYIPDIIWKMKGLRHLYLPKNYSWDWKTRLRLGNLIHLQTLVNFRSPNCDVNDLSNFKNLKDLEIILPPGQFIKSMQHFTAKLIHLRSLKIQKGYYEIDNFCDLPFSEAVLQYFDAYREDYIPYKFPMLSSSELVEDPMPALEKLPNLKVLVLSYPFIGKKMVCSPQGFPKLHSLTLSGMKNLEEWIVHERSLPQLCTLKIHDCERLKSLSEKLRSMTTMQELNIESMPKSFKDKLIEGGEDFYKVQHVPIVRFG